MKLKHEQQRLCAMVGSRCFVRTCRTDDALWVCDLPRHAQELETVRQKLFDAGFACRMDSSSRLWYVDWTQEHWEKMLAEYPHHMPDFPKQEKYHAAYALCRLWLSHPAQRTETTLPVIRRLLKLAQEPENSLLAAVRPLHDQAAEQLRKGGAGAFDAGRILSAWIDERSSEK